MEPPAAPPAGFAHRRAGGDRRRQRGTPNVRRWSAAWRAAAGWWWSRRRRGRRDGPPGHRRGGTWSMAIASMQFRLLRSRSFRPAATSLAQPAARRLRAGGRRLHRASVLAGILALAASVLLPTTGAAQSDYRIPWLRGLQSITASINIFV